MKNKKTILSIIVPVYNAEKYINKCLDSILEQSFTDFELILINDNSNDNSLSICKSYQHMDKRVVIINKEKNEGSSSARKDGIKIARGKYVGFVDIDDYIEKNFFGELVYEIVEKRADIVIGGWTRVLNGNKKIILKKGEKCNLNSIDGILLMLKGCLYNTVQWDKIYKKELFDDILMPKIRYKEDVYWNIQLFFKANRIVYSPTYGYNYVIREGSLSHRSISIKDFEYSFFQSLADKYRNTNLYDILVYIFCRHLLIFILEMIRGKNKNSDVYIVKKVIKSNFNKFIINRYIPLKMKIRLILTILIPISLLKNIIKLL